MQRLTSTVYPSSISPENKRGACPSLIDAIAGTCDEGCKGDTDCEGEMKCCDNGCGHGCFLPVAGRPTYIINYSQLHRAIVFVIHPLSHSFSSFSGHTECPRKQNVAFLVLFSHTYLQW